MSSVVGYAAVGYGGYSSSSSSSLERSGEASGRGEGAEPKRNNFQHKNGVQGVRSRSVLIWTGKSYEINGKSRFALAIITSSA